MATPRQNKLSSKKMTDNLGTGGPGGVNSSPRPNAWARGFASPQMNSSRPLPMNGQASPASFPPLHAQPPKSDPTSPKSGQNPSDSTMTTLSSLVDTQVMVFTNSGARHQGIIVSTVTEGDNMGVNLKNVKDLLNMNAPAKSALFVPMKDIIGYNPVIEKIPAVNGTSGGFRTDTDISNANYQSRPSNPRERPLEVWQPPPSVDGASTAGGLHDDLTLGGGSTVIHWDQFEANETMFGVKTSFDENVYTTVLDRSRPGFKEMERRAQIIADEILCGGSSNVHVMEERGQKVDDSGMNEEDKYGAVVRGPGAYVPPGARQAQGQNQAQPPAPVKTPVQSATANPPTVDVTPSPNINAPSTVTSTIPTITKQEGNRTIPINAPGSPSLVGGSTSSGIGTQPAPAKGADGLVNDFRVFVKNEKNRLTEKRQALAKNDMDKRKAELLRFSQSFKLNKPIPDDLVTILAKDEQKQKAIREKSLEDANSGSARVIGPSITSTTVAKKAAAVAAGVQPPVPKVAIPAPSATGTGAPAAGTTGKQTALAGSTTVSASTSNSTAVSGKTTSTTSGTGSGTSTQTTPVKKTVPKMVLQPIPPFNPSKTRGSTGTGGPATNSVTVSATNSITTSGGEKDKEVGTSASTSAAIRLNINASSFKPTTNVKASASTSSASSSQKAPETPTPPNPFFGSRPLNKKPVHLKEEFSPFKHNNKVPEASTISERWPYTGKRFLNHFGPVPQWILHGQGPHMGAPGGNNVPNPGPGPGAAGPGQHISSPPPVGVVPPSAGAPMNAPGAVSAGSTPGVGQPGYEEPNATPATGYVYYTPYPYPGMIPGVPPQHGGYMHPQYMQAIPYPPNMGPPNGPPIYSHQPMPGMPPPHFIPPPPGAYVQAPPPPGPNGTNGHGPRPSMPTSVPSHAHAYPYHQSPQMQHAVPYHPTMIMQGHHPGAGGPPPGGANGPPHMYDGSGNGAPPPSANSSTGPGSGSSNGQHTHSHSQHHNHHNHSHTHPHQHHPHHPQAHHPQQQQQHQSPTSMSMMASSHS